ncbi:TadE/TadG family type IV pilus assembly protein [Hyphomonas sp. UBA4494]|jgi:hypothetical protein|uniref:TadE/TadG family type IV pilus assembly protein n=1 Tax=Hyphomonas sp. UBA4494 TaxID=1946631 RepID=UPI0025C4A761|nr:pilus assembly protein TadG-related protein [Hyphomonas sp. UBA4494]
MRLKARSRHSRKEIPARTFLNKEDGAATVFIVVMFALMIAFTGMVIDVGRIMNIHSQANSYVDRVALAAAAELDGDLGAMERAVRAGVGDATDGPVVPEGFRFSLSGDNAVGVARMVFMSAITDDDIDPYARSPLAGDAVLCEWTPGGGFDCSASGLDEVEADLEASFVLVEATTETENYVMFPIAAALAPGIATDASVAPQAVAGFRREVCNIVPLFLCNPNEELAGSGAPFITPAGVQIHGKMGEQYFSGNFGIIKSFTGNGASDWRDAMARVDPNTSCISGTLEAKGGSNTGPVKQGMNVRFDIFDGPMSKTDPQYVPAANVTKGLAVATNGNNAGCTNGNNPELADTIPLPRDNCFVNGTGVGCTDSPASGDPHRFGDGEWDRDGYWTANHPTVAPGARPAGWDTWTRYQTYRYEISTDNLYGGSDNPGLVNVVGEEQGNPTCSQATPSTDVRKDRRVLIVAVANCVQNAGTIGNNRPIPVEEFAKVFVTEPIGIDDYDDLYPNGEPSDNKDIYYEMIGVVDPGDDDGILHEYPVLYR